MTAATTFSFDPTEFAGKRAFVTGGTKGMGGSEQLSPTSQELKGWASIVATQKRLLQWRWPLEPDGMPKLLVGLPTAKLVQPGWPEFAFPPPAINSIEL